MSDIAKLADSFKEDVVHFLREIVAIPSPVGREEEVIRRIKQEMGMLGYDEAWVDPLGNLIGRIGSGNRILAFDGHCDTVDVGNERLWACDPFKGMVKDGDLYGRGSCDQKGGLAAAVYAGRMMKEISDLTDTTILVVASVLEEGYEGYNWDYIIEKDQLRPHAVVLTEPSNLKIALGHKGRTDIRIFVEGISSHGSRPDLGENAVYKMLRIVDAVRELSEKLPTGENLGPATMTVTRIKSFSPNLNAVPDGAEIFIDRRLTDHETSDLALAQLCRLPEIIDAGASVQVLEAQTRSYTGIKSMVKADFSPWSIRREHPLVKLAQHAYSSLYESSCQLRVWDFSTNGVSTRGKFGIPTIGFGPGHDELAHRPNEKVPIAHLIQAMAFYTSLAVSWQQGI